MMLSTGALSGAGDDVVVVAVLPCCAPASAAVAICSGDIIGCAKDTQRDIV